MKEEKKKKVKKSNPSYSSNLVPKSFEDRLNEQMTRRKAISKIGGVAIGVAAGAVVAGSLGYLAGASQKQTTTQTVVSTVTQTASLPSSVTQSATGTPIKMGLVEFMTGGNGTFGQAFVKGLNLLVEVTNNNGGVLGRPVSLDLLDDTTDYTKDVDLITKLITVDKVDMIIGPGGSGASAAQFPIWYEYGFPVIDMSWTVSEYTSDGAKNGYFYNYMFPGWALSYAFLDYYSKQSPAPKTAAMITLSDPAYAPYISWFKGNSSNFGMSTVYTNTFASGLSDFTPIATALKSSGADVVLMIVDQPSGAAMTRAMDTIGYNPLYPPMMNAGPDAPDLWGPLGNIGLNVMYVNAPAGPTYVAIGNKIPQMREWLGYYNTMYGSNPSGLELFSIGNTLIYFEAMKQAGSTAPDAVRNVLKNLKIPVGQTLLGWGFDCTPGAPYNIDMTPYGMAPFYGQNNTSAPAILQYLGPNNSVVMYPPAVAGASTIQPWPKP